MNELVLPVPKTVSATYRVPMPTPVNTVEARQQASRAVEARLTGPLRELAAEWLAKEVVKVGVEAAGPLPPGMLDKELFGTPEQRVFLARARAFVRFSATQRASSRTGAARSPSSDYRTSSPIRATGCSVSRSRAGTTSRSSALSWMLWPKRRRPCRKLGPGS